MIYLQLFFEFFKTGLFALGGGLATFPFLMEIGNKYGWYTSTELADMIAISESTPGSLGINTATYCGFRVAGIPGAIISTVGEVLPSIIVICIVVSVLERFKNSKIVNNAFEGIRPAAYGLMCAAVIDIFLESIFAKDAYLSSRRIIDLLDIRLLGIFALIYIINGKHRLHPIYYVAMSAIIGVVLGL